MEGAAKEWTVCGSVTWIGLALSYLMLLRISELFAEDDGKVHATYSLRGEDVSFYAGKRQVGGGNSPGVDTVEVRFGGSEATKGERGPCW